MDKKETEGDYLSRVQDLPHYYGDYIRILFMVVAAIAVVTIPIFGDLLPLGVFAQVAAALVLVLLAGLIHPHGKTVFVYSVVVAGLGALLIEVTAIYRFAYDPIALFVMRETAVLALLFAFYLSVKTLRAAMAGKVGKMERPWEFEDRPR